MRHPPPLSAAALIEDRVASALARMPVGLRGTLAYAALLRRTALQAATAGLSELDGGEAWQAEVEEDDEGRFSVVFVNTQP